MAHVSRDTVEGSIIIMLALEGLPHGECQFRRLGYLPADTSESRIEDPTETNTAGEAHFAPPDHSPIRHNGVRIVEPSPTEPLGETLGVVLANLDRNQPQIRLSGGR